MAEAMGITGATLTHHLNALEGQGLVHRWRDAGNREALFARLRQVAATHDRRLRSHLTDEETAQLAELLEKLQAGIEPRRPPE
jgi:MarR family transcriptional regulator for hemolysin